jgi:hypothetical protein
MAQELAAEAASQRAKAQGRHYDLKRSTRAWRHYGWGSPTGGQLERVIADELRAH